MDEDLSMGEADLVRIIAALAAKRIRVTIDALRPAAPTHDRMVDHELESDRVARHELGIRGVWVHDVKDLSSTHSLEALAADPEQQRRLIAAGAVWVGPRHLAPT
ncbi:MAG: hypothetical protein ABI467_03555 [Kofleriaceae bacterium]